MRLTSSVLFFLVFIYACSVIGIPLSDSYALSSDTHPFSIHDMLAMDRISEPQVSPNGKLIVFTLRATDLEADKGRTDIWLIGADDTNLRRLTSHPQGDFNPRWAPDGKSVLFISTRSDSSQVWCIRVDGGEAQQVTDLPLDVGNLLVSPDRMHIAFTMEVFPDCKTIADTKNRLDEIENRKTTGRIYEQIFVRHWDTWKDGRRSHLFVMPGAIRLT
jgi:dipeptidyl aminopeptidase/acylaminoacyl peptidase